MVIMNGESMGRLRFRIWGDLWLLLGPTTLWVDPWFLHSSIGMVNWMVNLDSEIVGRLWSMTWVDS